MAYIKMIAGMLIPMAMIGLAIAYGLESIPAEIALGHAEIDVITKLIERIERNDEQA